MNYQVEFQESTQTSSFDAQVVGKMPELFKGCQFMFIDKDNGKRPVFVFKNATGQFKNVILSTPLAKMYRAKEITGPQMLSLDVLKMDIKDQATGAVVAKDVLFLSAPGRAWKSMDAMVAVEYTSDDLAGF